MSIEWTPNSASGWI